MKVLLSNQFKFKKRPVCIATLGIFDGLHQGHIYILKKVIEEGKKEKFRSLLINLFPHPLHFYHKKFLGYLTTQEEKIEILKKLSLDYFWIVSFDRKIAKMRGANFLDYVLKYFNIKKIIVAKNFRFGYKAQSNIGDLKKLCNLRGIKVKEIRKKRINKEVVNSSLIRRLIKKGDFKTAKLFLGRAYSIKGQVIKDRGIGKKALKIPTVNLDIDRKVIPPLGVYITKTKYKNKFYKSISNLGFSPTFRKKKIVLETHLINFNKDIYKDFIEVTFIKKLRPERKFSDAFSLRRQIYKDIDSAKKFFSLPNILGLP